MNRKLDVEKAVQAAAELIQCETGSTVTRLRLLKLLYIADRRCLKETGKPLIGDRAVAMDCGPLHSTIYNMIKGESIHDRKWSKYIRQSGPRDVHLQHHPGNSKLSRYEVNLLRQVSIEMMPYGEWELVDLTHGFAEYKKANASRKPKSSVPIPLEDIIDGVLRTDDKAGILQDIADSNAFDELFGARA